MNRDRQVPIQSLGKAMRLLDILQEQGRPMHLAELAQLAGYPKSSVYALLTSMRAYSYIEQRADGRYALGIRLYECGRTVSAAWDISSVARPYLEQLAEQTGASAVITYLENGHIINLEQVAGRSGVQVLSEVGTRLPLHATAQGKLYLATCPDAEARALLSARGMPAYTPHTLTELEPAMEQLAQIRRDGYAIENGEYKIGLRAVDMPVHDRDGTARYAVSVVGLFRRINSSEFEEAIAATLAAAQQIATALGYRENIR